MLLCEAALLLQLLDILVRFGKYTTFTLKRRLIFTFSTVFARFYLYLLGLVLCDRRSNRVRLEKSCLSTYLSCLVAVFRPHYAAADVQYLSTEKG